MPFHVASFVLKHCFQDSNCPTGGFRLHWHCTAIVLKNPWYQRKVLNAVTAPLVLQVPRCAVHCRDRWSRRTSSLQRCFQSRASSLGPQVPHAGASCLQLHLCDGLQAACVFLWYQRGEQSFQLLKAMFQRSACATRASSPFFSIAGLEVSMVLGASQRLVCHFSQAHVAPSIASTGDSTPVTCFSRETVPDRVRALCCSCCAHCLAAPLGRPARIGVAVCFSNIVVDTPPRCALPVQCIAVAASVLTDLFLLWYLLGALLPKTRLHQGGFKPHLFLVQRFR